MQGMTRINKMLLSSLLTLLSSCSGQNTAHSNKSPLNLQSAVLSIGEPVAEMDKGIMVIFQDKHHNIWFGSSGQGVYKYDGENLTHFTTKDGLCSNNIWSIQEDQSGNIYFDSGECISQFDGKVFNTLTLTGRNASNNEWKLEADDLWFKGTWDKNGPYRYDGKALYHLEFPKHELEAEFYSKYPNPSYSPYGIYTTYKDRKGHIWFGTSNFGACRYDGASLSWISEEELMELDDGPAPGVRSIIEDKEGNYWFSNSLYRYEVDPDGAIKRLKGLNNVRGYNEEMFTSYMSITDDGKGNLWIATYDEGVWKYDGEKIIHFPITDGQKNVTLFSVYKDRQGGLWLGTHDAGPYKFNGKAFEKFKP